MLKLNAKYSKITIARKSARSSADKSIGLRNRGSRVRIPPGAYLRIGGCLGQGENIDSILAKYGKPKETLPIFLGDDLIDEDGFKVINKYGGISVFVGEAVRISAAEYFLRSPAEVEDFLGMLVHKDVSH